MGRPRLYDTEDLARGMRERFRGEPVKSRTPFPWRWPSRMRNVGDSLAVGYESDKWRREPTPYIHLAESRNKAFCVPGFLVDYEEPSRALQIIGPTLHIAQLPMPREFSKLDIFERARFVLHTGGSDERARFGSGDDDGVVEVQLANGFLGGSYLRWDEVHLDAKPQAFLFVYTERDGPLVMIVGKELDVLRDGIVG